MKLKLIYHKVNAGETLQSIADRYYGDFKQWPYIQAQNGVVNPGNLKKGQILAIPRLASYASNQRTIETNFANSPQAAVSTLEYLVRKQERLNPGLAEYSYPGRDGLLGETPGEDVDYLTVTATRLQEPLEEVAVQARRIPWYAWIAGGAIVALALRR